jgi:hypothetical protein
MPKVKKKMPAVALPGVPPSPEERLDRLLNDLLYMRQQLLKLDPDSLNDAQHEKWRSQVNSISLAITKVRNAALAALNAAFAAELPDLEKSTGKLTDDLYRLKAANEIIGAIGEGLGIVAKILTLLP